MKKRKVKRQRLSEKHKLCLLMVGLHGRTGSYTEFSHRETRKRVHDLGRRKLVQWAENKRWILTPEGHAEWSLLVAEYPERVRLSSIPV